MDRSDNSRLSLLLAQSLTYYNREPLFSTFPSANANCFRIHTLRLHDNSIARDIIPQFTSAHTVLFPVYIEDGEQWNIGSISCVQVKAKEGT
jgi:hypothetical protein